jgi:tRNA (guanine-N7-)-methyltransferase
MNYDIQTTQKAPHENLKTVVLKHLDTDFQRPISDEQRNLFNQVDGLVKESSKPVILDSCCGTGLSTIQLAKQYPDHFVIGIDKSLHRLQKNESYEKESPHENLLLVRANLIDFWRLASEANWNIQKHFLFYPNPYPKANDLTKRWHGHPIFPALIKLSPYIEIRSNWQLYLEEFMEAAKLCVNMQYKFSEYKINEPMTLFEKKYQASNVAVYQLIGEER